MKNEHDALQRVREAVVGKLDPVELTVIERPYYYDLLDDAMAQSGDGEEAQLRELVNAGGAVGYDEVGRLVRSLPSGKVEAVKDTTR